MLEITAADTSSKHRAFSQHVDWARDADGRNRLEGPPAAAAAPREERVGSTG